MKYKESGKILESIKKSKRILVGCHRNPDPDSIGSALAMYGVLKKMKKEVEVISPTEIVGDFGYLSGFKKIKTINFLSFDFHKWDLFLSLDSSSWNMVSDHPEYKGVGIQTIVIDHHKTNEHFGDINIVDEEMTSTAELLYWIFRDLKIEIDSNISSGLLTGIIGDTGVFRFPNNGARTFRVGSELMEFGANKDEIVFNLYSKVNPNLARMWGIVLVNIIVDSKHKFYYVAIDNATFKKFGGSPIARESSASQFGNIIDKTDFSIFMFEQEKGILSISFRSRTGFDTSKIAKELGGGGHVYASGAKISGMTFIEAKNKVLKTARKYAKH